MGVVNASRRKRLAHAFCCLLLLGRPGQSLASANAATQAPASASFTVDQVKGFYSDLFAPSRTRGGSVAVDLATLPASHPLARFVTENEHLVRYLLTNHGVSDEGLRAAAASPHFPDSYFELLRGSDRFGVPFLELVHRFLGNGAGGGIAGYQGMPKRQVTQRTLLNTAVRFVYPDAVENGRIRTHICSGINGLGDLGTERDVFVESLAYSTIVRELYLGNSPLVKRITRAVELAESLGLTGDASIAMSRAQGVVWADLRESPELRDYLRREFNRVRSLLPIEVEFQE